VGLLHMQERLLARAKEISGYPGGSISGGSAHTAGELNRRMALESPDRRVELVGGYPQCFSAGAEECMSVLVVPRRYSRVLHESHDVPVHGACRMTAEDLHVVERLRPHAVD